MWLSVLSRKGEFELRRTLHVGRNVVDRHPAGELVAHVDRLPDTLGVRKRDTVAQTTGLDFPAAGTAVGNLGGDNSAHNTLRGDGKGRWTSRLSAPVSGAADAETLE